MDALKFLQDMTLSVWVLATQVGKNEEWTTTPSCFDLAASILIALVSGSSPIISTYVSNAMHACHCMTFKLFLSTDNPIISFSNNIFSFNTQLIINNKGID